MIRIYRSTETNRDTTVNGRERFWGNGIAVLEKAQNVCIKQSINGEYSLEFKLPRTDKKWAYVVPNNIAKIEDRLFRISKIDEQKVVANAIYYDAGRKHIQYISDTISQTPRDIMLKIFEGTNVHIMTAEEVKERGMEWVTDLTDLFEASCITPIGLIKNLMETLKNYNIHSELYVDNYNLALVKQIGRDRNKRLDPIFNAKNIKSHRDVSGMYTRVYPYGKDGLHIGSVNGGVQYIDSPGVKYLNGEKSCYPSGMAETEERTFPYPFECSLRYDNIEDPNKLLELAKESFNPNNPDRIDVPKYMLDVEYVERQGHKIYLGDTIKVYDPDMNITTVQRVISKTWYPLEPNRNKVEVGTPIKTITDTMGELIKQNKIWDRTTNEKNQLKTHWLEFMQDNESTTINNSLANKKVAKYSYGAIWVDESIPCAVAIIDGRLAIANSKKSNGDWKWTAIMDSGKVIVGEVFTGILHTEQVQLMGEDAKLTINNNIITFKDETEDGGETLRSQWGFNGNKYIFEMYNKEGDKTLHMNEDGEAEFGGVINTQKDVNIGRKLVLRDINNGEGFSITGQGDFLSESVNLHANNNRTINITTDGNITIKAGNILNLKGEVNINGVEAATKTDIENVKTAIQNLEFKVDALHA